MTEHGTITVRRPAPVPGLGSRPGPVLTGAGGWRPDRPWLRAVDGRRLRQVRRAHGLSQERLAWASKLDPSTVARLERQPRTYCTKETLAMLAENLGGDPAAFTPPPRPARIARAASTREPAAGVAPWTWAATFPARADQVGRARHLLAAILGGDCPVRDDAVLICSELAANAVIHSASAQRGGTFTVAAEVCPGDLLWLEVQDAGGPWLEVTRPGSRSRGLDIVAELAEYWEIRGDSTGRAVGACLDWPEPAS